MGFLYAPASGVNAENLGSFRAAVTELADGRHEIVVDCSALDYMSVAAMRVLENAAHHGGVRLTNPTPVVRLLAAVFGLDVEETAAIVVDEPTPTREDVVVAFRPRRPNG